MTGADVTDLTHRLSVVYTLAGNTGYLPRWRVFAIRHFAHNSILFNRPFVNNINIVLKAFHITNDAYQLAMRGYQ